VTGNTPPTRPGTAAFVPLGEYQRQTHPRIADDLVAVSGRVAVAEVRGPAAHHPGLAMNTRRAGQRPLSIPAVRDRVVQAGLSG